MAGTKFTSGTALAKLNGLNINLSMTKLKQVHVTLHSPARSHIYSAKRKSVTTSFVNGKCLLPTASKKAIIFWTLRMKSKELSNQHTLRVALHHRFHQLPMCSFHPHDYWSCPHWRIQTEILSSPLHQLPLWRSRGSNMRTHCHGMRQAWPIHVTMQHHHQQLHLLSCRQPWSI